MATCVATWSFGKQAVEVASRVLSAGGNCIDSLEKDVEDDPSTGPYYVGRGSYPNAGGVVQLDAAIMRGRDCRVGAVAALEGFPRPLSVARCVMERTKHSMFVGAGAGQFARENGFPMEDNESLLAPSSMQALARWRQTGAFETPSRSHDTLAVLCLDRDGSIAVGVSTSGPPFKLPGRVGDSPLPGCGYYADDTSGAAAATGDGDVIMQFCPCFHIVQKMKEGSSVGVACSEVVGNMAAQCGEALEVGVVALDMKGNVGTAGTVKEWTDVRTKIKYKGFPYSVWKQGMACPEVVTTPQVKVELSPNTGIGKPIQLS